jgi:hypothetical protein
MTGLVARIWEKRNAYRILVGIPLWETNNSEDREGDGRIVFKLRWI